MQMPAAIDVVEPALLIAAVYLAGCAVGFVLHYLAALRRPAAALVPVAAPPDPPPPPPVSPPVETLDDPWKPLPTTTPAQRLAAAIESEAREKAAAAEQASLAIGLNSDEHIPFGTLGAAQPMPDATVAEQVPTDAPSAPEPVAAATTEPRRHLGFGAPVLLTRPRGGGRDDLTRIRGIGPRLERALNALGVYHVDQVAGWDRKAIVWIESRLSLSGRVVREKWVEQARGLHRAGLGPRPPRVPF